MEGGTRNASRPSILAGAGYPRPSFLSEQIALLSQGCDPAFIQPKPGQKRCAILPQTRHMIARFNP